jgi:hypothetical protein
VTRFTALSTTGMHGVNIAICVAWAFRLPAPQAPFSPAPGSMPASTPPALRGPESDSRSDLSLTRNGCASQRLHSGVNVPGLPLRIPTGFLPARSVLWLHNLSRFAPASTASTPQTRCRISTSPYRPFRTPPLPLWAFYRPSGSKCSAPVQPADSPSELARFPFAPRCRRL